MNNEIISVIDVAKNLGQHKAHVFRILRRLSIETIKEKCNDARGQKIAYITTDDYNRVKEHFAGTEDDSEIFVTESDVGGVFYLIQLEPEHDPGRFKLGFATNIDERLRSHKTAAPFSKVLKTWSCKLLWEKTAIESVSQDCVRLHTEVFRSESIDEVKSRCEEFFKLMPKIKSK
jgi:hypothetical protein